MLCLVGCSSESALNEPMTLREKIIAASSCSFDATVTADYGEMIYSFGMHCIFDQMGNMRFSVTEPESIAGITGKIVNDEGALTFDDRVLVFELLSDGQVTPVSAPWLVMRSLRSGYIRSSGRSDDGCKIIIDDSYTEDALKVDVWLNENGVPRSAELVWQNRRILSVSIEEFNLE